MPQYFRKSLSLLTMLLASSYLLGCSHPASRVDLSPRFTLPLARQPAPQQPISVSSVDQRSSPVLGQLNAHGQLISFTAARDLRLLMQEMLEKQLKARGYLLQANSPQQLRIVVNQVSTQLTEGSLRHQIDANISVTLLMSKAGQQQTKQYQQHYQVDGALGISNQNIASALTTAIEKLSQAMASDNTINAFFN